jgi:uncharacterized protein YwqG
MITLPDIETYRKTFPVKKCEIKYYTELDFLDIADDIKKLNKKKNKSLDEITTPYHSVGFFLNDKLVRIDNVGAGIPTETYIVWENGLIKEAHEFYLGVRWGKKISNKTQLSLSWYYTYENNLTKKVIWVDYEDRKYYDHGEMTITYDYEYDKKGLLLIRQTVMGTGKLWKEPQIQISYDREKEIFLKSCTITKSALIGATAKASDNVINFRADDKTKTSNCTQCNKPLSYIATIRLLDKRFNLKNIEINQFPILHCFDCLETQNYNAIDLDIPLINKTAFTEITYKFKRTTDEEILGKAFLKVGGRPAWIQEDEHPKCPSCDKTMKFIIEIKTDETLTNGVDTLAFGDSGKLYVFACCNFVTTIPQWY